MLTRRLYPRFVRQSLEAALADTPAVLIHGPRQSGKTTLARTVGDAHGYSYLTLDNAVALEAARADPIGFIGDLPDRVVLDEVQRAPGVFAAMKTVIDRDRTPGRFILTGSANVLLVPTLADSLAGRMEILRLHPLAQCEIAATRPRFLETLFSGRFTNSQHRRLGSQLVDRVVSGGYPAALARPSPRRRAAWYREYVDTIVQRDVRDLARIGALDALPRLLQLAAGQTSRLLNVADLSGPFQLSRPTIRDYVTLLEGSFCWSVSRPGTPTGSVVWSRRRSCTSGIPDWPRRCFAWTCRPVVRIGRRSDSFWKRLCSRSSGDKRAGTMSPSCSIISAIGTATRSI